ncbi:hypothetical protein RIR_jg25545.t1 [Rhizophagus irregularis DAOM 181602=DAOM 197198]|nr:hypothetical protein RIR_jg25545.t1 [Rhizophagus irregularis DAOM 181602=DAOM 197198]
MSYGTSLTFLPSFLGRPSWNVDFGLDFEIGRTLNILSTWFGLQNRKKRDEPWILYRSQILYRPGLQNKKEVRNTDLGYYIGLDFKQERRWTSQNVDNGSDFEIKWTSDIVDYSWVSNRIDPRC